MDYSLIKQLSRSVNFSKGEQIIFSKKLVKLKDIVDIFVA